MNFEDVYCVDKVLRSIEIHDCANTACMLNYATEYTPDNMFSSSLDLHTSTRIEHNFPK